MTHLWNGLSEDDRFHQLTSLLSVYLSRQYLPADENFVFYFRLIHLFIRDIMKNTLFGPMLNYYKNHLILE